MKTCVIFGAAECDGLLAPPDADSLVIAADGGLRHTERLGIRPDRILGDFDSLGYSPADSRVYPVEKDDTDLMLAVRLGLQEGCRNFLIYGALDGPRLDHTVANFQTLAFLAEHGGRGWLIGRDYIITVASEEALRFSADFTGILSLFCLGAPIGDLSIRGLKYPLEHGTLTPAFPLAVSNAFEGVPASVEVGKGLLLAMWDRANGLCIREALC